MTPSTHERVLAIDEYLNFADKVAVIGGNVCIEAGCIYSGVHVQLPMQHQKNPCFANQQDFN